VQGAIDTAVRIVSDIESRGGKDGRQEAGKNR
jgi:hypothetical protein